MSSSRSDRGRASAGKTRASKESGELRQKRRLMSPVADPIWPEPTNRASESKNRSSTRRNASLQRTSRNDPPGMRKSTARKGSVENETQRRARKASPKDEFTHGRDNIEQVRKTFFKGGGPDKARKSTANVAKEKSVITTVPDDDPLQSAARVGRKSMIPARRDKDAKPLNRPDPEQMHGRVIQKVNYEAEKKEPAAPVQKSDDPPVKRAQAKSDPGASEKKQREDVPMSIRQSKTKQEEYPKVGPITRETKAKDGESKGKSEEKPVVKSKEAKREEEAPKVLTSKDRAALRVAQLAKLKQVDPDLGDALQRQSLIERIRGILAVQQEEEEESENEEDAPKPRMAAPKPEALPTSKSSIPKQESPSSKSAAPKQESSNKSAMPKQESPSKAAAQKQESSNKSVMPKQESPSKVETQKQESSSKSAIPKRESPSKAATQKQVDPSVPKQESSSKSAAQKQDDTKSAAPKQESPSKPAMPKSDAPPRPRVSFDLSNLSTDGRPTKRIFEMPDFLEGLDDSMEPVEEKPFTEPTDFLKAYRFPTNYIIASMAEEEEDEGEEDIDLMPRKAPPVPEPEPEPLPRQHETEEPTDDSVVSLTLVREETPEKPRRAEFSPSKSPMDKFSESVSLDEFVKLETEMIEDEGEEEDDFDRICPNFTKLSSVVKQVLGDIAGPLVAEMALHKPEHFVFLISQDDQELEAIYLLKANLKEIAKLWGDGPDSITPERVSAYWYFNAVSKQFETAKKPGFRHNLDAVSL